MRCGHRADRVRRHGQRQFGTARTGEGRDPGLGPGKYAEGTASRDPDLWPMKARTGVARLALRTGAPVIPMAIWGAQDVLPYGTSRPHLWPRKTIRMAAGPPVDLSAFQGLPLTATNLRNATAVVMADVTALLAGLRGETPPAVPYDPDAAGKASISRTGRRDSPAAADAGPQAGRTAARRQGPTAARRPRPNRRATRRTRGRIRPKGRTRRPARGEGGDHGGRVVGDDVRPGALRRRNTRGGLLPGAGTRPGDQRAARESRLSARHPPHRRTARGGRPHGGTGGC